MDTRALYDKGLRLRREMLGQEAGSGAATAATFA